MKTSVTTIKTILPFFLAIFCLGFVLVVVRPESQAQAETSVYYVDQSHPQANDTNPGTELLPWMTIQHAANIATAGDTIYVKSGHYPERIEPQNSGAPGQPITFVASPRRGATMFGFYTVNTDYLRIAGFLITSDPSLTGWTERYGIFIRSDHVEVVDNYFYDIPSTAIQGYWHDPYPVSAYIADNHVYRSQKGLGITGYAWLVENNEVERLYDHGGGDCDYSRFFGDDHVIRGNHLHSTNFNEIGSAHVDCFQTFDNNGEFAHNVLIEGNLCSEFHQGFMGEAHYYHDISHLTFKNNVFKHGLAWGLAVEDISYLSVLNNTFVDIQHHGVGLSGPHAHHATIRNNIFYDTGTSYWFPDNSNSTGDYNLVYQSNDPPVPGLHDIIGDNPEFIDFTGDNYHLQPDLPARNTGEALPAVDQDYDGVPRPQEAAWDIGAFEFLPALTLHGAPTDQKIHIRWTLNVTVPTTSTWDLSYTGGPGMPGSPITGLPSPSRAFTLTGLTNYTWYTVTLSHIQAGRPIFTDTVAVMPSDKLLYLAIISK